MVDWPCSKLSDQTCTMLEKRCLRLEASNKHCDMLMYHTMLATIEADTLPISREIRQGILGPFVERWARHAAAPQSGRKDMTARPLEQEIRGAVRRALEPLGVSVPRNGKRFPVWSNVPIVADVLTEKQGCHTRILSIKTWLGTGQIRETFGYAYLVKT